MKTEITLYTFIINSHVNYAETQYMSTEVDMCNTDGYIFVGKQTVTMDVPDGDIQEIADAHRLEVLTKERLTLVEQKEAIEKQIEALNEVS